MRIAPEPSQTVTTARLVLRRFTAGDIPAYAAIRGKPEVMRHMLGGEARVRHARADAARLVAVFAEQWATAGYAPWAAVDRETGRLLGHVGLRRLPELDDETEILYLLDSDVWGRGLATEAAAATRDWAFARTDLPRLVAFTRPENVASWRVMEKIGMTREGVVDVWGIAALRYIIRRDAVPTA